MRVLFIIINMDSETPEAANIWSKNLAKSFSLAGHDSTILYIDSRRKKSFITDLVRYSFVSKIDAIFLRLPRGRSFIRKKLFKKYIMKYKGGADLVIPVEGPYTIQRELFKVDLVKKIGAKYLLKSLEHPKFHAQSNSLFEYEEYMKKTANLYDYVMPITQFIRDEYIKYGRVKPFFLNPIIAEAKSVKKAVSSKSGNNKELVYCGNLAHTEEMEILFNEFSFALKECSRLNLTVIGGAFSENNTMFFLEKYRVLCENLGIENAVKFTGRISHENVFKYYDQADVFLLPRPNRDYSKAGFPSKLGEYLMTGKPVVAYPTGDIALYLKDNVSAYLVENEDLGSFGKRIVEAIKDLHSSAVGEQGAKVAVNSFSIEATAGRIKKFFENELE